MSQRGASAAGAAYPNDKRCGGALAPITALKVQPRSRSSEFKQLHRHYARQLREVVRKSASKREYAPAAVVQSSAWADGDYSWGNPSQEGDPLSDSEEDDDDFDEGAMTAKRDATASLLLVINQPGEPARCALLDVVTALRANYQAQRRKWRRAVEDTTALLQHFACSADDNESSPDVAELMRMNLAKIVARDVGAQDVDVVHETVFFELMRLLQELQRGERMRWILLQTYDELQALAPTLDREWQRLQEASAGQQTQHQQQQTSSSPRGTALTSSAPWSPSMPAPRLASSGPQRDYLSRGASRTVGCLSPPSSDAPQPQAQQAKPPQTRLSRLLTTTQIRNEAEAQRATDEARALEALPGIGDDAGGGEGAKNGECGGPGETNACVDALREFADLIDTACGQGMGLVSVNEVIEAIAEDIKEKLREAMVGVREEMKPVLYSAEADRDGGEIDDDQGDEGLDQSASAVTTALLSSASVLKKGWLVKKGEVRRNWKVRYFVLFEDGRMPYYRAPKRAQRDQPQGCIYLTGKVRLVRPATDKSVPPNLWAVEVVTATRTYVLCCRSQADLDLWCFHLQSFCSS